MTAQISHLNRVSRAWTRSSLRRATRESKVEHEILGDPRPLPSAIDLSAYRIVQEALTNTIKHAGPASARVVVGYLTDRIEIEVLDNGRGAARELQNGKGRGHGLVGMRERAALYGGQLKAGPRAGGGYSVKAAIPLEVAGMG